MRKIDWPAQEKGASQAFKTLKTFGAIPDPREGTLSRGTPMLPNEAPTTNWNVRIDATLAARVEMALWDSDLRKPKYGARRMLIEHLLSEWLQTEARKNG